MTITRAQEELIADVLSNWENTPDEEIIDVIVLDTGADRESVTKLVQSERPKITLDFRYEIPFHLYFQ